MNINFEKFPLIQGINGSVVEINLKEMISNAIYNKGQGIAFHALALKIYNSKGDTEYTSEECNLLMEFACKACSPNFIDSLNSIFNS